MTIQLTPTLAAESLRGLCGGNVSLPGDPAYDEVRVPWNLTVDQRPAAIALPRNAAEVSEVVRAAAAAGLRVAPQSTGHNAGPLAAQDLDDVVIIKTSLLDEVSVDAKNLVCRVGRGVVWAAADTAAAAVGLAALHGSSPNVGIAGYSLGGGTGWYARKLGLATNNLTAIELVIADGTLVRTDADNDPELFWALRGGGGNFGVVTALEFRLFDFDTAYAGMMIFDATRAREVLRRWTTWAVAAPDEVTTAFRILHVPPLPEVPEFLRGRSVVVIDGAVLADDATSAAILAPLRDLGPELDTFGRAAVGSLIRMHMDPETKTPGVLDSVMLASMPEAAIEVLVAAATAPGTTLLGVELRQLGGALGRPHPGGGAVAKFEGQFLAAAGGIALTPEMGMQVQADALALTGALSPWASGSAYLNFAEDAIDPSIAFPARAWDRLKAVKSTVDPHGLFVGNHAIPPR